MFLENIPCFAKHLLRNTLLNISGIQAGYVRAQVRVDFNIGEESGQLVERAESPC